MTRNSEHRPSPVVVYRCYDVAGRLLYVGCSSDHVARLKVHRREKPWWSDVHSTTLEHYETRAEGEDIEEAAIKTELPRYNVALHPMSRKLGRHPRPPKMKLIPVAFDQQTLDAIAVVAQAEGRSRSGTVRRLIDEALAARQKEQQ